MTRHDLLVHTAAPRHRPMGWCAPSAAATGARHADPTKSAYNRAFNRPDRRPLGAPGKLGASAIGIRPTAPKQ